MEHSLMIFLERNNMKHRSSEAIDLNQLTITQPISMWNKDINFSSPKKLLQGIGKMAIKVASADLGGVGEAAIDTIDSLGLKIKPGEVAWLLIYRSLFSAISNLVEKNKDSFKKNQDEKRLEKISGFLEKEMLNIQVTIDVKLFKKPEDFKLLKDLKMPLINWMKEIGSSEENAKKICNDLPKFFIDSLDENWRAAPQVYKQLKEHFNTPFTLAKNEIGDWEQYNQWLVRQVTSPVLNEKFGVEKVYVPLRAYYVKNENNFKKVIDLESHLFNWLNTASSKNSVKFLSGDPGSGKTTFSKMFAIHVFKELRIPTIYIPLHLFDTTGYLIPAMEKYIQGNRFLSGNPLDPIQGIERLFIIFDGLDEIFFRGKANSKIINQFVKEVLDRINEGNSQGLQRKVLITGRTITMQTFVSRLTTKEQICYLLPYFINDSSGYDDPYGLIENDQRDVWWEKFGNECGTGYNNLPDDLNKQDFEEITSQPFWNHLFAISYYRKEIDIKTKITINQIFENIINGYLLHYEEDGKVCIEKIEKDIFLRVLEEIALAMWHSDGRSTTISNLEKIFSSNFPNLFDTFQEASIIRLLNAFYFQQSEFHIDGEPIYEFSHKNFGEYFTSLRILRELEMIHSKFIEKQWDQKESIKRWSYLCAPVLIDKTLLNFIDNELIKLRSKKLSELQITVCNMLSELINNGVELPPKQNFKELLRSARNTEISLLSIHFSIAKKTTKISKLQLNSNTAFGEWISRLRGQRINDQANHFHEEESQAINSLDFLGFLDLSGCILIYQDFSGANFVNSKFEKTFLSNANLSNANFENSDLSSADLHDANLRDINFTNAKLIKSKLSCVDLSNAELRNADLTNAKLSNAILIEANLHYVKLVNTDLHANNIP